jgi:hypothetical protein
LKDALLEKEASMVTQTLETDRRHHLARKLDAVGWGAFFVWIGVVLMADVSAGWTLMAIGLIMLGVQIARTAFGLRLEGFLVVVGGCFLLGGIGQIANARLGLGPVFMILAGLAVIFSSLWPARWRRNTPEVRKP